MVTHIDSMPAFDPCPTGTCAGTGRSDPKLPIQLSRAGIILVMLCICGVAGFPGFKILAQDVSYDVQFEGNWTTQSTPGGVVGGAHFTTLIGAVHSGEVTFWEVGGMATRGVELVAELGSISQFRSEVQASTHTKSVIQAGIGGGGTGTASFTITVSPTHPEVTLLSMIGPSPDWFVGISDESLLDGTQWRQTHVVDLFPYDAGTEEGTEFVLSNAATSPQETITSIKGTGKFSNVRMARLTFTLTTPISNREPTASASCTPCTVKRGEEVELSVTASDPDNDPLTYAWSAPSGRFVGDTDEATATWEAGSTTGQVTLSVKVSDGQGGSATATVQVTVTNSTPSFDQSKYDFDLNENASGQTQAISLGQVSAKDADGDALTYSITSGAGTRFTINAGTGQVSYVGAGEDYETTPNQYALAIRAQDPLGARAEAAVTVSVTDVNELPTAAASCDPCTVDPGEEVALSVTASDPEGDPLTYAWSAPSGRFVGDTDEATATWEAGSARGRIEISVEVSAGQSASTTATVQVNVANNTPSFDPTSYAFDLNENSSGQSQAISLGQVSAKDADGDALTYSITSGAGSRFAINAGTGQVSYVGAGEDYETTPNQYALTIRAQDPFGAQAEAAATVSVTDVNELPTATASCDPCTVDRGEKVALSVAASDPDGDPLTYAWGAPSGRFIGDTDEATTTWEAGSTRGQMEISVVVSDGQAGSITATVQVNVANSTPSFDRTSYAFDLNENSSGQSQAIPLGQVSAKDADGDALTYSISSGAASRFAINAGTGQVSYVGEGEDYETAPNQYALTIRAQDPFGAQGEAAVTVSVADVNELPTAAASCDPCTVDPGNEVELSVNASDPDGDPLTYAWSAPSGRFVGDTDEATVTWEAGATRGQMVISVEVSDGRGGSTTASTQVNVANSIPSFDQSEYAFDLNENSSGQSQAIPLGQVSAQDADGDALTYSITSGSASLFAINAGTGQVSYVGAGEDYETAPNQYALTIRAQDPFGAQGEAAVTVSVSDLNELPTAAASCDPCTVDPGNEVELSVNASDPDGDPLTYAWSAPSGRFVGDTDEATVTWEAGATRGQMVISVEVSDGRGGSTTASTQINVANSIPSFDQSEYAFDLNENSSGQSQAIPLGQIFAQDADGDALTYSIASGAASRFAINANSGQVSYVGAGEDYETPPNQYELVISAEDPFGAQAQTKVIISVTDVNEIPTAAATCNPCKVERGGQVSLSVTASDPDGDPLTYAWSAPSGKFVGDTDEATATWEAEAKRGQIEISVVVSDGRGGSATATVRVDVTNSIPSFDQSEYAFDLNENSSGQSQPIPLGQVSAQDADGDALTYSITSGATRQFAINANSGQVSYVGAGEDYETEPNQYELTIGAEDPLGAQAQTKVVVNVTDINEIPTAEVTCTPCRVARGGQVSLSVTASDPDGDPLTYAWSAPSGKFVGAVDGAIATWEAGSSPGQAVITAQVMDPRQGVAMASIEVGVFNREVRFDQAKYRFSLPENAGGNIQPVNLGQVIAVDPDGDPLTYSLISQVTHQFAVGKDDGTVSYTGPGEDFEQEPNLYELIVLAADPFGAEARTHVEVRVTDVDESPAAMDDRVETQEDSPVTVNVLANDRDPEGGALSIVSVSPASNGTVRTASEGGVIYTPQADWHGTDRFTYVAADASGLTATAAVIVMVRSVNDPPIAIGAIPDQQIEEGGDPIEIELLPYFEDVDGDALIMSAISSDPGVVAVSLEGTVLTLQAVVYGTASISVTAEDTDGLAATQSFAVGVTDRPQRVIINHMMAATARGLLASARSTLRRRIETGQCNPAGLTLMGQPVFSETERSGIHHFRGKIRSAPALALTDELGALEEMIRNDPGSRAAVQRPGDRLRSRVVSVLGRAVGLNLWSGVPAFTGADFNLPIGDCDGQRRLTLWGQSDLQSFKGTVPSGSLASAYDGQLWTGYAGVDVRINSQWLAGLAMSRSRGTGDWSAGSSEGQLTQTVTALHPYLRWANGTTSVWAATGAGLGDAENVRSTTKSGTSDMRLLQGIIEGRRRFGSPGGLEASILADASWARLTTDDGEQTIDGQTAQVTQQRVGADLSLSAQIGASALMPFGQVYLRRDAGDGQTGGGVEAIGGFRATLGPVRVDAQARTLAFHTAEGYRERGASLMLTLVRSGANGLSLSVAPSVGQVAGMGSAWDSPIGRISSGSVAGKDDFTLNAHANYGMTLAGTYKIELQGRFSSALRAPVFGVHIRLPAAQNSD